MVHNCYWNHHILLLGTTSCRIEIAKFAVNCIVARGHITSGLEFQQNDLSCGSAGRKWLRICLELPAVTIADDKAPNGLQMQRAGLSKQKHRRACFCRVLKTLPL